jgi:hypothetical protein
LGPVVRILRFVVCGVVRIVQIRQRVVEAAAGGRAEADVEAQRRPGRQPWTCPLFDFSLGMVNGQNPSTQEVPAREE